MVGGTSKLYTTGSRQQSIRLSHLPLSLPNACCLSE